LPSRGDGKFVVGLMSRQRRNHRMIDYSILLRRTAVDSKRFAGWFALAQMLARRFMQETSTISEGVAVLDWRKVRAD
jgi:hypothetical protein